MANCFAKMLIPGSCWAMLWHVLLPLVLLCSQLSCSSFWLFRGVWALMLSSLSLCSPREWSLACLALSGPFATTGFLYIYIYYSLEEGPPIWICAFCIDIAESKNMEHLRTPYFQHTGFCNPMQLRAAAKFQVYVDCWDAWQTVHFWAGSSV